MIAAALLHEVLRDKQHGTWSEQELGLYLLALKLQGKDEKVSDIVSMTGWSRWRVTRLLKDNPVLRKYEAYRQATQPDQPEPKPQPEPEPEPRPVVQPEPPKPEPTRIIETSAQLSLVPLPEKPKPEPKKPKVEAQAKAGRFPSLAEAPVGAAWGGRVRFAEHVWFLEETALALMKELGEAGFTAGVEKLNNWIAITAPAPGERPTKEYQTRLRNGWNAAHTFRAWVIRAVREDEKRAGKQQHAGGMDLKGYYGL